MSTKSGGCTVHLETASGEHSRHTDPIELSHYVSLSSGLEQSVHVVQGDIETCILQKSRPIELYWT